MKQLLETFLNMKNISCSGGKTATKRKDIQFSIKL